MREGELKPASEEWIGQLVRLTWVSGNFNGQTGKSSASRDVGVVIALVEERPDLLRPGIVSNRLLVWWPDVGTCNSHPAYHLWPVGEEER